MVCLSGYNYEVLLKNTTLEECEKLIMENSEDVYLVPGGYKVRDLMLMGTVSPVGFSGSDIILKNETEEIERLRNQYKIDKNVKKIK